MYLPPPPLISIFFFFNDTATTEIYTLSLHDALPICCLINEFSTCISAASSSGFMESTSTFFKAVRSEEHTSELQSPCNLVCRLLLEKKKKDRTDLIAPITHTILHEIRHDISTSVCNH